MSEWPHTTVSVSALHPGLQCWHAASSAFRQPSPTCRTAFPAQHLRPSGVSTLLIVSLFMMHWENRSVYHRVCKCDRINWLNWFFNVWFTCKERQVMCVAYIGSRDSCSLSKLFSDSRELIWLTCYQLSPLFCSYSAVAAISVTAGWLIKSGIYVTVCKIC